jgi:DNA-binding Lrp family transcriptional regulator
MAALGYLLIECSPDRIRTVLARLKRVPGVRDAHIVTGSYDIIAIVEAPDPKALGEVVLSKVQSIPGVHKTTTNLAVE